MADHFLDASVVLMALGEAGPDRDGCRAFMADAARRGDGLHMSVGGVQEVVHHRMCRGSASEAVNDARALLAAVHTHDFDANVLATALDLIDTGTAQGRDAVHAATALRAGFSEIVSLDRDFDGIPGLTRVDPRAS